MQRGAVRVRNMHEPHSFHVGARRSQAALQQHKQRYVKARTRLFRDGIFKGLQAQNEAQEAKERAQQAAAAAAAEAAGEAEASDAPGDDDDMPGLEDV